MATINDPSPTLLTHEGHAKLKAELDDLINNARPQIAQQLLEARAAGDIRENAPYDAAKQQQALVEARIRELQRVLANAEIISDAHTGTKVTLGTTVVLHDVDHDEEIRYQIVNTSEANPRLGKISSASPVGRAILDRGEGDVVEVTAPAGTLRYRIERIERG
ncbi:MAG: transcription elongation factor GreA [Chloroflexi bacterium]|nr:transcription elongation factor GreA [Chloroflexota bacterium]